MSSDEPRSPLVNQIISDKTVVAENIGILNMGEAILLPPPHQLPSDIDFFSGRISEVAELKQALSKEKSVIGIYSLWGMGGVGKSALAIHVASEMYRDGYFQDGILFSNFGEATLEETLENFIRAFNYSESQIPNSRSGKINLYRSILKKKQVLVFLDNVQSEEQVLSFLLDEPTVSVIATSRKNLLALTEYSAFIKDLDVFSPEEGEELIRKRISSRYDAEPLAARKICELAGNLPLAISLAAASLTDQNKWPILQKFVDRLEESDNLLDALSGSNPKERGLRRVFQVSYESLSDDQKKTIALLTLFGKNNFGSSGLVALTGKKKDDAIDQLDEFVNLSLLLRSDLGGYRFHDLLQIFTEEKISDFSELELNIARSRLENYLIQLKQARKLGAQASSNAKRGNLTKAIELYLDAEKINQELQSRSGQASALGGLASAFAQKGELDKAIEFYQQAIIISKEIGNRSGQANSMGGLASAFAQKGELDKAIEFYHQAIIISKEIGNRSGQANSMGGLASAFAQKGELDKAIEFYQQDLDLCKELGNRNGQASALGGLASVFARKGDLDQAIEFYQQAIIISKEIGNRSGQANSMGGLASAFAQKGDLDQAIEFYQQSIVISKELGNRNGQAMALGGLASVFARKGDLDQAIEFYQQAQLLNKEIGNHNGLSLSLGGLATVFAQKGDLDQAIEFYQQSIVISKEAGNHTGLSLSLGGLATVFAQKGDLDQAIEFYQQSIVISQKIGNRASEGRFRGRLATQSQALIGLIDGYSQKNEWMRVIEYQERALKLSEQFDGTRWYEKATIGIAYAYEMLDKYDDSITVHLKVLELYRKKNDPYGEAKAYRALAGACINKGDFAGAIEWYLKAQEISERNQDLKGIVKELTGLAIIYYWQHAWQQAIVYFEKVLELNRKTKDHYLYKTLYHLAVAYKSIDDLKKAKKFVDEAYQITQGKDLYINELYKELNNQ